MIVGIDIGATKIRIGIKKGRRIEIEEFYTPKKGLINFLIEKISHIKFRKIAIGVPGTIDIREGKILNSPNLKLRNIDLKRIFEEEFNKKCFVVNDAIAAGLGEKIYGRYEEKDFIYITISSGIGGCVIMNNKVLLGKDGNAHEVGHMVIDYKSDVRCSCGRYGHWEAFCSGNSIPNLVKHYVSKMGYKIPIVKNAKEFFEVYRKYEDGRSLFKLLQKINAKAIASLTNLYDPERIVIGGSVALNNKSLINMSLIKRECLVKPPKINFSKVKNNGVLGCFEIAMNGLKVFK